MAVAAALHNFLRARTFNPVDTFDIKLDWRIMERLNGSEEVAKTKSKTLPTSVLFVYENLWMNDGGQSSTRRL